MAPKNKIKIYTTVNRKQVLERCCKHLTKLRLIQPNPLNNNTMKTAEEILNKNHYSRLDPEVNIDFLIKIMEEYASQFKQSVPITEEEIESLLNKHLFSGTYDKKQCIKELKDRLQSDAVLFAEWLLHGDYRLNPHIVETKWIHKNMLETNKPILESMYLTTQELYNSQEFSDYKKNLNK